MTCTTPDCGGITRVLDSRESGASVRRRRECDSCGVRFTTYEVIAEQAPVRQRIAIATAQRLVDEARAALEVAVGAEYVSDEAREGGA